jgi:ABC-type branched-subunit amino acid transport system substrate-binding protein
VDSGSISTGVEDLYVLDDCVADLKLSAAAKRFTKAYEARYGAAPNFPAAHVWDAFHMAADAIDKAKDHDPVKINKAMQSTNYKGVCDYAADKNNALARAVHVYSYKDDHSKKLIKSFQLPFLPSDALSSTAPPTTAG